MLVERPQHGAVPVDPDTGHTRVLDPGDVPALAAALDRLASDEPWRADLARAAGRRGAALPRWSHTAATLFAALRELTASAR